MACAAWLLLMPAPAQAACDPRSVCSCTVTATSVSFGNYNTLSSSPMDSTGSIRVQCTLMSAIAGSYAISLSTGSSGTYTQRTLRKGSASLTYNLFTDTTHSVVWGNGTGNSANVTRSFPATFFVNQSTTVYARIPVAQNVPGGAYSDTITVTVTY
jgi:spore coat protein U-like protein